MSFIDLVKSEMDHTDEYQRKKLITAWIGFIGHPVYWALWQVYYPDYIDTAILRFLSSFLCLLIILDDNNKENNKEHSTIIWFAAVTISLPSVFTYTALANNYEALWLASHTGSVMLLLLLINNIALYLTCIFLGHAIGAILYIIEYSEPIPPPPLDYIPVLLFLVTVGGIFIRLSTQAAINRERTITKTKQKALNYQSIAGGIAHEMRNPLSQAQHCLNAMDQVLPTPDLNAADTTIPTPQLEQAYRYSAQGRMAIHRGTQIITMLLNQVHDKPIDQNKFVYLSASRVVQKALEEYGYGSEEERARVHFQAKGDFTFLGDETLTIFVLFNLLKNALFYLSPYPDARVDLSLESDQDSHRLIVRDTGPGIKADRLDSLFKPFQTSREGGTGLGLAYCKRVLLAYGGDITVRSEVRRFTEFTLHFPPVSKQQSEAAKNALLAQAKPVLDGRRVLLVDDDANQRALVREHLRPLDLHVDEAQNGAEAWQRVQGSFAADTPSYDIVIIDLNMPVMNGYELALTLSAAARDGQATGLLIAHTSEPAFLARSKAERVGMTGFLSKPCGQEEFLRGLLEAYEQYQKVLHSQPSWTHLTALLVDDAASLRTVLAELISSKTGMRVLQAASGQQALDCLAALPPGEQVDMVMTDINMPGMDGHELAQALHAQHPSLPILGISGDHSPDALNKARQAGMAQLIDKSVNIDDLIPLLADLLQRARPERALLESTPVSAASSTPSPALDLHAAAQSLGCDVSVLQRRLPLLEQEYATWPEKLRSALHQEDMERLYQLSHKLKGSARLFHAQGVITACTRLEAMTQYHQTQHHQTQLDLEAAVDGLIGELDALLTQARDLNVT